MIILPAIDLFERKAVRLYKGDYSQMTVYSDRPWELAEIFSDAGAGFIHAVDLEGARDGSTPNFDIVKRIALSAKTPVEIGGGIRSLETIEKYLSAGVSRVILGTAAVTDEAFLINSLKTFKDKIAIGVDIKDGTVAIKGWTESSDYTLERFTEKICSLGAETMICTDISRDGAMRGVNRGLYRTLQSKYPIDIVASGGVSTIDDVKALAEMKLYGAIIGKAYYTGAIDLKEAVEVAKC